MNYYSIATPERFVPATQADFEELTKLLEEDCDHGFSVVFDEKDGVYLLAEESGNPDDLPDAVISKMGKLLKAAKIEHLNFGIAYTADRNVPGSHGGGYFRITDEGVLEWQESHYNDENPLLFSLKRISSLDERNIAEAPSIAKDAIRAFVHGEPEQSVADSPQMKYLVIRINELRGEWESSSEVLARTYRDYYACAVDVARNWYPDEEIDESESDEENGRFFFSLLPACVKVERVEEISSYDYAVLRRHLSEVAYEKSDMK